MANRIKKIYDDKHDEWYYADKMIENMTTPERLIFKIHNDIMDLDLEERDLLETLINRVILELTDDELIALAYDLECMPT
jgi:hypothetical protein